jgi:hypothetical protein
MTDLATLDIRIIVLILVVALLTARSVGKGLGERLLHEGGRKPSKFDDASMRLLSLLLAFIFGMSIQRHDQRRLAVVADANAIGDFYTCASILKEPLRTKLQDVIRQYAQLRLQTSFFLTRHNATTWIWDVGPIFQFPHATNDALRTGRWSAGPTAAVVYSEGPWFNGILAYRLMSFAGNRNRGSENQTFLEPDVSYNFESGWYVQCEPSITYDWTAEASNAWTIPMGAGLQAGLPGFEFAGRRVRPGQASRWRPQWIVRVSATFLFPRGY